MKFLFSLWVLFILLTGCESAQPPPPAGSLSNPAAENRADSRHLASSPVDEEPVQVGEIEAGRQIAKSDCLLCHGMNGVEARSGAPFIAGLKQIGRAHV